MRLRPARRWVPGKPTVVHLVPRPGAAPGLQPRTFTAPPCFIFHHANGFESDNGRKVGGRAGAMA